MTRTPSPRPNRKAFPKPGRPALALAWLCLANLAQACTPSPTEVRAPVVEVGTAAPALSTLPPDTEMLSLGASTLESAALLARELPKLGQLISAYRRSLAAHPPPPAFHLAQAAEGEWAFRFGWHRRTVEGSGQMLARFELGDHSPVAFDVLRDSNYSPDLHPHVPANVSFIRMEANFSLGALGQLAVRCLAPLSAMGSRMEFTGSGSLAAPAPLGAVSVEALALILGPDDRIETGTLVMKSIGGGAIRQVSGELGPEGLRTGVSLLANGARAGTLEAQDGRWVAKGGGQTRELPTGLTPPQQ